MGKGVEKSFVGEPTSWKGCSLVLQLAVIRSEEKLECFFIYC